MMIWSKHLDSPCYSSVKKWVADFKQGRESTDNNTRTGRPKSATTDALEEGIHCMVMNGGWVTVKHLAETLSINVRSVHTALAEIKGMSKLSARWVSRMLTPDQDLNRLELSRALFAHFQSDPANFLKKIVTQDETCVYHFDPK